MNLGSRTLLAQEGPLLLTHLSNAGTWSLRNLDGERVGYYATRAEAVDDLESHGFHCASAEDFFLGGRVYDGSRWERM